MTTTIPVVGLSNNDPVPGNYVSVQFAQGASSAGQTDYSAILIGNCLSGSIASSSAGTVVYGAASTDKLDSEADAISLFGEGSELHGMFRQFRAINKATTLYAIAVPESAGNKATGTVTLATTATAPGTVRLWIGDQLIDAGVATGDTPTVAGDNLVAAVNALSHLPCVASNSTGTVTLTSKQKGMRGNQLRYSARIVGAGVGMTVTPSARTLFTGGTTADSIVSSLATIANSRYYYYVPACEDQTQLALIDAQLDEMASPIVGMRQRCVAGAIDAAVTTPQTVAIAVNNARMEICLQASSDWTTSRIAAHQAAIYSYMEESLGGKESLNFNDFGSSATSSTLWRIPAPLSGLKLTRAQIKSALNNGVTPITTNAKGNTYLVRRITTRSLNGAVSDYRIRDAHKVTVSDRFADDVVIQAQSRFGGKVVGSDVVGSQKAPGINVVTPKLFKGMLLDLINTYDQSDLLQDVPATVLAVDVIREPNSPTRISYRVPLKVVDILNSTAGEVNEVSQG